MRPVWCRWPTSLRSSPLGLYVLEIENLPAWKRLLHFISFLQGCRGVSISQLFLILDMFPKGQHFMLKENRYDGLAQRWSAPGSPSSGYHVLGCWHIPLRVSSWRLLGGEQKWSRGAALLEVLSWAPQGRHSHVGICFVGKLSHGVARKGPRGGLRAPRPPSKPTVACGKGHITGCLSRDDRQSPLHGRRGAVTRTTCASLTCCGMRPVAAAGGNQVESSPHCDLAVVGGESRCQAASSVLCSAVTRLGVGWRKRRGEGAGFHTLFWALRHLFDIHNSLISFMQQPWEVLPTGSLNKDETWRLRERKNNLSEGSNGARI